MKTSIETADWRARPAAAAAAEMEAGTGAHGVADGITNAWKRETGRLRPDGDIEGRKLGAMGPQWKRAETEGEVCWSVPDPWRGREG